jgi:enoyl-CoA hydratase/carnithine racemase
MVPSGGLEAALSRVVSTLKAKPREALRLTQELLRSADESEILARMDLENGHFSERLSSHEVRDAITAFVANRSAARAPS